MKGNLFEVNVSHSTDAEKCKYSGLGHFLEKKVLGLATRLWLPLTVLPFEFSLISSPF